LIGGNGRQRTLPLVARFAREWNALLIPPAEIATLNKQLDECLNIQSRHPQEVRRSLMTGCIFGLNHKEVEGKVNRRTHGQRTSAELRQRGLIVGTADEIVQQCQQLTEVGIQRVMLQWLDLDDIAGLEAMADGIIDKLSN
jgi:alkanesulfonate monooxygenase SsuD/methylene tetrahydromethanopterin reductase-like flavin-dependent oxidoreductase (luciferase family)